LKRENKKKSLEVVSNNLMPRKIWCNLLNQTLHWKKQFRVTKASVHPNLVFGLDLGHFLLKKLHEKRVVVVVVVHVPTILQHGRITFPSPL
jgi:hypothetical protein